jgi:hypothetical protein
MACSPVRLNVLNVVGNLRLVDWLEFMACVMGLGTFGKKIPVRLFSVVREP